MRRITLRISVALLLVLFFGSMSATVFLKQPFSPEEDVMGFVGEISRLISAPNPDWSRAERVRQKLKPAWETVRRRIQFAAELDDIARFEQAIDELKASLAVADRSAAAHRLELLRSLWEGMR